MTKSIFLVEHSAIPAMAISDALEDAGYRPVGPFASASEALECMKKSKPDYAILDVTLKDGTSIEIAHRLSE